MSSTNTCGASSAIPVTGWWPAWMSAIEAPSLWPIRIGSGASHWASTSGSTSSASSWKNAGVRGWGGGSERPCPKRENAITRRPVASFSRAGKSRHRPTEPRPSCSSTSDRRPSSPGHSAASSRRAATRSSVARMAHRVDAHGDREHERLVLARRDLDPVGVANPEPLLRHLGHRVAVALDLVLVVDEVALGVHVMPVLDLDHEAVADADEALLDGRQRVPVALDRHLVAHGKLALL